MALLLCSVSLPSLALAQGAGAAPELPAVVRSLAVLASNRPVNCNVSAPPAPAPWQPQLSQCAWHGALSLRRWSAQGQAAPACVSLPALWWQAQNQQASASGAAPIWNAGWRRRALVETGPTDDAPARVSLIERAADGGWLISEWRWTPPARLPTREWERQRWRLLVRAAEQVSAGEAAASPLPAAVQAVGRRQLAGRPGEFQGESLVWQGAGQCLRLRMVGAQEDPELSLPYAREDSRLEQRSASQVQLARALPGASWPVPFHLMLQAAPQQRSASYAAIARRRQLLIGRLWLPVREGQPPLRLRVETDTPAPPGSAAEAHSVMRLDRELSSLTALWIADHEH